MATACAAALLTGCGGLGGGTTPAPSPTSTPSATPTVTPVPGRPLQEIRELLLEADSVNVAIFGDSTGDEMTEWPALWAQSMTSDRAVTLNRWLNGPASYEKRELSTEGASRTLWNCSVSGWKPINFAEVVDDCLPQGADVVVISLGHNNNSDPTQTLPQLEALLGQIREETSEQVPIVITMQNPVTTPERLPAADEVTKNIAEWAIAHRYPVIDAYHAFVDAPGGPEGLLKDDGLHPNERGSQIWADAVTETLTPWRE
ncbi:MAG: SGNH/GDSL hydrolase family protein [Propionibacteriaceae bacterium]|nr:SGNH/GDSL hydrolase family protein [Propionibacteriaceae bacterium]